MDAADKLGAVRIAVRYCMLKNCGGLGLIEETELRKLILASYPRIGNIKPIMEEANKALKNTFGVELVAAMQTPSAGTFLPRSQQS